MDNTNAAIQALRQSSNTLTDTFAYTMQDSGGLRSSSTLTVTIQGANDTPVATADYNTAKESIAGSSNYSGADTTGHTATGNVLTNDTDVDRNSETKTISGIDITSSATGSTHASSTVLHFSSLNSNVSQGYYVFLDSSGSAGTALRDAGNNQITVQSIDTTNKTFTLSAAVANATLTNQILGFANNADGNAAYKTSQISSSTASSGTQIDLTSVSGTIAVGMTVSGTDITSGTTITAVTRDGTSAVTGITLSQAAGLSSTALTFTTSAAAGATLTGGYGTLVLNADGSYTYTPTANNSAISEGQSVTDSFAYQMKDSSNVTSSSTLYITVLGSGNNDPRAVADTATAVEAGGTNNGAAGTNPTGSVITNDTATVGSLSVVAGSTAGASSETTINSNSYADLVGQYGTLRLNSDGGYTYTVTNSNADVQALRTNSNTLTDTFVYRIRNTASPAREDCNTLTITLQGANDAPVAVADTAVAWEAGGTSNANAGYDPTGNVLANDTDVDSGDAKTVSAITDGTVGQAKTGTYGTLTLSSNGTYTYAVNNDNASVQALAAGSTLTDTFTYTVQDTAGATSSNSLTVTINGANDAPVNTLPSAQSLKEYQSLSISGLSVNDADGNLQTVQLTVASGTLGIGDLSGATISAGSDNTATLTLSGTQTQINAALATLTYQGNAHFSGGDALTVVSTDSSGLKDTDTLLITVQPDDRTLSVNDITVNEGSPYAIFTVTGVAGQKVSLALGSTSTSNDTDATAGTDFSPNIEYYNGSQWLAYSGAPVAIPGGGTTLLVRTAIMNDAASEGAETFTLVAGNTAGATATGTATITDDGTGTKYPGTLSGSTPDTSSSNLDDDRPLTINDIQVNESSTYAVFTVEGATDQAVTLSLQSATATVGTDTGSGLEYYNGSAWQTYGSAVAIPAGGKLFVRTTITSDSTYEGPESFALKATNTGGGATTGTALILDDGTGTKYTGTISGSAPVTDSTNLDDDRTLTVTSPTVNEASGYTVFTVTGNAGQQVTLTLGNDNDSNTTNATLGTDTAATSTLEVWNSSTSTWVTYDANDKPITPGSSGTGDLLVRLAVTNDATYEGAETLTLTAAYVAGGSKEGTGTATIKDDGTGTKYPGTVSNGTPDSNTSSLDNDTPTVSVSSVTVSEASPYAVFTVSLDHASTGAISFTPSLTNGTATVGTDTGNSIEYYNGSSWTSAASGITLAAGSTSVLVRAAITNDTTYEGSETFTLSTGTITGTVTNSGAATGTGTIKDDGSSTNVFLSSNNSATPTTGTADDDRAITVTSPTVNENSPYAVFTVAGTSGQSITLALAAGTATGSGTDYGASGASNLEVSTNGGSSWTSYSSAVTVPAGNSFLVRTPVIDDAVADNGETFTLTATPAGGTAVIGTATIKDDGTGTLYNADGTTNSSGTLDDDRPLAVSDVTVSEASPYAVFTVSGTAGQSITLALVSGTATVGTDTGAGLQYLDGSTWTTYSGAVTLPAGGQLLVRTSIANDSTYEGAETFKLRATNTGGTSFDGTGTLKDDGSSTNVFLSGNNSAAPTTGTADNDADTTPPTVALSAPTATLALGEATTVTLRFSEVPFGLSIGDFSISGGTLSGLVQSLVDPKVWTATFTQTGTGAPALSLRAASYTDEAGNGGGAGSLDFQLVLPPPLPEPTPPKVEPTIMPPAPPTPPATPATPVIDSVRPPAPPPTVDLSPVPVTPPVTPLPAEAPPVISPPPLVPSTSTPLISLPVTTMGMGPVMDAQLLVVTNPGPQQAQTGKDATFQLPAGVFRHTDPTARTKVEATLIDGQPLPDWLKFDPGTGKFSGTPPEGTSRSVDIKVTAQDDRGNTAGVQFALHVSETTRPPALTVPAAPARPVAEPAIAAPQPAAPSISPPETVTRPPVVTPQGASPQLGVVTVVDAGAAPGGVNLFVAIQPTAQEVSTGKELAYQLPTGTFRHTDTNARTQLEATQTDGRPLPGWLSFDPGTGKFSGVPPEGARGVLDVKVVARDNTGQEATVQFRIRVTNLPDAQPAPEGQEAPAGEETRKTLPPRTEATDDGGALADAGETGAPRPAKGRPASVISLPGRPSLQEQMARFGRQGQERDYGDLLRHLKSLAAANARSLAA